MKQRKSIKNTSRDDFPKDVIELIKIKSSFICSNPNCRVMTVAPSNENENIVQYIGVVAHITAASEGGPRYDNKISSEIRKTVSNAIFLCNSCSTMIDKNNGIDYSVELLKNWKSTHEKWILENLNKSIVKDTQTNMTSYSSNQSGGFSANVININGLKLNNETDKTIHDQMIFQQADKNFNEDRMIELTTTLIRLYKINSRTYQKLHDYKNYCIKYSNSYLNSNILKQNQKLLQAFDNLFIFVASSFEKGPETKYPFGVYYQFTLKNECIQNLECIEHLITIAENIKSSYLEYRKLVKETLFI